GLSGGRRGRRGREGAEDLQRRGYPPGSAAGERNERQGDCSARGGRGRGRESDPEAYVMTASTALRRHARYGPPDHYLSPPSAGMCLSVFALVEGFRGSRGRPKTPRALDIRVALRVALLHGGGAEGGASGEEASVDLPMGGGGPQGGARSDNERPTLGQEVQGRRIESALL